MSVTVRDAPDAARFEIEVDGTLAGFAQYRLRDGHLALTHTEVGDAFAGRGLASRLVRYALDSARERGLEVLPFCPFVAKYIAGHGEYLDLVPEERRTDFDLPAGPPGAR